MFFSTHQKLYDIVVSRGDGCKNIIRFLEKEMKVLVFSTGLYTDYWWGRKTISLEPKGYGVVAQKYDIEEFARIIPDGLDIDQYNEKIVLPLSDYDINMVIEDESIVDTLIDRIKKMQSRQLIIYNKEAQIA